MNEPQSSDTKEGEGGPGEEAPANHWHLLRDVLAFQVKLALDGIRDLLLSPLSIIAVLAGVIASPRKPDRYFRRLMHLGHRSDRWINLFGITGEDDVASSDAYVRKVEEIIVREYQKGGVVRNVKDQTDNVIRRINRELPPRE